MNRTEHPLEWLAKSLSLVAVVGILSSGCGGGGGPSPFDCVWVGAAQGEFAHDRQDVLPTSIDASIDTRPAVRHIVMVPRHVAELRDELYVFLPGTDASPKGYEHLLRAGAFLGYRTIGLAYDNLKEVRERCLPFNGSEPDCTFRVRQEIQTGADVSDQKDVNPANSIDNRLLTLLQWLHTNDPSGGWDAYFDAGGVIWSRAVVAGHSQGAGQTAWIANQRLLARAVFFSNPGDAYPTLPSGDLVPSAWSLEPRVTPPARMFSMHHVDERIALVASDIFDAIGLSAYGPIVDASLTTAPYGCSHTLSISTPAVDTDEAHDQVAHDSAVLLDANGIPLLNPAYLYLLSAEPAN